MAPVVPKMPEHPPPHERGDTFRDVYVGFPERRRQLSVTPSGMRRGPTVRER
jgi:hypothetical protein